MPNKARLIKERSEQLEERLKSCDLCPRNCRINRKISQIGYCQAGSDAVVYTAFLHQGEEPVISGKSGSGTIFFSGCNLRCIYCQNYKFSHSLAGKSMTYDELSDLMLKLQRKNAHNINLVTPTHFLSQILKSLYIAVSKGLNIPIVYNTSGYEKKEIIELLFGIVDVYLPDMKYAGETLAIACSSAKDYYSKNREAVKEMYRQHKSNHFDGDIIKSGLIVRHLVIPGHIQETLDTLSWIKENIPDCLTSVMFQYQPYFKASLYPPVNRTVNLAEYEQVRKFAQSIKLNGWIQDLVQREDLAGVYFNPSDIDCL